MAEKPVFREVMKPAKSASDGSEPARLDADQLASLLKDSLSPDGGKRSPSNSRAAAAHGDSAVKGAAAAAAVSSTGPTKTVTTERHRVVTDEIGYDVPREDTTSTSFEAHVRMRIARPRVPETKAAVVCAAGGQKAAHGHAEAAEASTKRRHRSSSSRRSAATPGACVECPDCGGGGGGAAAEEAASEERSCDCERGCCCCFRREEASFSSCSSGECSSVEEDASSPSPSPRGEEEQWYSAASVSSRSACSGCQTPEIGPLLHTTAAFCQSLARALSGEHQGNRRRC